MSRSEGLIQRKNAAASSSGTFRSDDINKDSGDEKIANKQGDDIEDHDSKEARLTLMEEVLLLGLKDKEVGFYAFMCCSSVKYFSVSF